MSLLIGYKLLLENLFVLFDNDSLVTLYILVILNFILSTFWYYNSFNWYRYG